MRRGFAILLLFLLFPLLACAELTRIEHTEGNLRWRDYVNEAGEVTFNEEAGYATIQQTLDGQGNVLREFYFDEQGEPIAKSQGYYGLSRIFNDNKQCVEFTYLDERGEPMIISSGYAMVKRSYNENGKIETEMYFDTDGKPKRLGSGQYGVRRGYNADGKNDVTTYLDADGQPVFIYQGYCTVKREYDEEGRTAFYWYYDTKGLPKRLNGGQYGARLVYENGKHVKTVPIDLNGRDVFILDEYLKKQPLLVSCAAVVLLALAFLLPRRGKKALLAAYVLFVFYMTLLGRESGAQKSNMQLFWSYRQLFVNRNITLSVLENIVLFIPLGTLLCLIWPHPASVLPAVVLTVFIESAQYFFRLGLCELDDVFGNTLGALVGWAFAAFVLTMGQRIRKKRKT